MGLLTGSASITRYRVSGSPPSDYRKDYPLQISRYSFRELNEASIDEKSFGWVNIMDLLDNQFIGEEFFKDHYITLSLRMDVRKVPANALKCHRLQAEAELKEKLDKKFLSKGEREEIKERIHLQLLKRAIPQANVYDMIWNVQTGKVLFYSNNKNICEEFTKIFNETFGLSLIALFPYTIAEEKLSKGELESLNQITACSF